MAEDTLPSVLWTNQALQGTLAIKKYLRYKFSNKEIDKFYQLLQSFEKLIIHFPELYPLTTRRPYVHRAVLSKQLSVFYHYTANQITVLAVSDNRVDLNTWL